MRRKRGFGDESTTSVMPAEEQSSLPQLVIAPSESVPLVDPENLKNRINDMELPDSTPGHYVEEGEYLFQSQRPMDNERVPRDSGASLSFPSLMMQSQLSQNGSIQKQNIAPYIIGGVILLLILR